jgi:teichuronic acid exporter
MSFKNRTFSGLFWVFTEQIGNKAIQFIIGIILARLLMPEEFGLIGMITVFIAISEAIASGGFNQALIRKKIATRDDYDTAFLFNSGAATILYLLLFFTASLIAGFYGQSELVMLIRVVSLAILFDAVSFVQRVKLYKAINFKALAKVSIISQIVSGGLGISAAYMNFGVWSLVIKIVVNSLIMSISLVFINRWTPSFRFSKESFTDLFGFGSKILLTQIIERLYRNIYLISIGKFFSAADLGYYSRAEIFKNLVSDQLVASVQKVTLPVLANLQDSSERLASNFKKLTSIVFFVSSFFLIGLIPVSGSMILFLIGEKWQESIVYLQLLAVSAILYPVGEININILQVKGRSDIILKLQLFKKLISIPLIIVGIMLGIKYLIVGIIISSFFDFFANSYYSGRIIGYSSWKQIENAFPSIIIMIIVAVLTFVLGKLTADFNVGWVFLFQTMFYGTVSILFFDLVRNYEYLQIKQVVIETNVKLLNRLKP